MNLEQTLGIVRHSLTLVGGILIAKGYIDEAMVEAISGGVVGLVGLIWSVIIKNKNDKNI